MVVRAGLESLSRRQGSSLVRALVASLSLLAAPATSLAAPVVRPTVEAALRWVEAVGQGRDPEAPAMARTALLLAGPECAAPLAERLASALPEGGAAPAWALGLALAEPPEKPAPLPPRVRDALLRALESRSLDARLAAASSLGALDVAEATPALDALVEDPGIPRDAHAVVLLALAGTGGAAADRSLRDALWSGGGPEWANAMTGILLRRGRSAVPLASDALRHAPDVTARAVGATVLLLRAEPDSTCDLIEAYGREPEPSLKRVVLQAVAAARHPLGRDFLRHVATVEREPELAEAARLLSLEALDPPPVGAGALVTPTRARELLRSLARDPGLPHHVDEVERGAERAQAGLLDAVLARLPLRGDARWRDDHARLAQLRARLLCLDGLDCTP